MMIAPVSWLRWKLLQSREIGSREGASGIGAAAVAMVAVLATGATGRAILINETTEVPASVTIVGSQIPTADAWTERLSDPSAWRGGRYIGDRRGRRSLRPDHERADEEPSWWDDDEEERPPERTGFNSGTYRTVCVRLCDGFFFPISFATTPENFSRDSDSCNARCGSPARLYVYPNPGGEPEQMVGLDGKPYSALKSAFLFRTNYDAACTCKAQPWSQEALARHRAFAEARKKADTRTVARTIRSEQPATPRQAGASAETSGSAASVRPGGAMLLGADQPPPRALRKSEVQPKAASRSGGSSRGRSDWQRRAFSGD
jgi:hypothetical protein